MNDDVAKAIQSAKYGESVQITLEDEDGCAHEVSLVAVLDAENGGVQWSNADLVEGLGSVGDPEAGLRRHLRTKRWFFPMLNDHKRNALYEEAITRAAEELTRRVQLQLGSNPTSLPIQCLDIGSGTGLLAMMSAKKISEAIPRQLDVKVTSLEMSHAMAKIAQETVKANALDDSVHILEGHSCEIVPLEPRAIFCTSELLESGLLAEGWLPAMRDAWNRHLDPAAIVVPQHATIYAQVVGGTEISNFWGPHELLDGFPGDTALSLALDGENSEVLLGNDGEGIRVPLHFHTLLQDPSCSIDILSEPLRVLDISVASKNAVPSSDGQSQSNTFIPSKTGVARGVVYWWELELFQDVPKYSTKPTGDHWQDHWHQCLFVFSKPTKDCVVLQEGVPATLKAFHDDLSISFDILPEEKGEEFHRKRQRQSTGKYHNLITAARAWQLNDVSRLSAFKAAVTALLQEKGINAPVLDLSDFSLCSMVAALLGATNVSSLEASSTTLPEAAARVAQFSNGLPLNDAVFQIIRCHPEQLMVEMIGGRQAEIVAAEPYYEVLEGWELQQVFNYLFTLKALKGRNVVSKDALSVPQCAKIMGQVLKCDDIVSSYRRCNDNLRGFNHSVPNRLYSFNSHEFTLPSWQYNLETLSSPFELAQVDFDSCTIQQESSQTAIHLDGTGKCHGMIVWVQYVLPGNAGTLSTYDRPHNQLIRLLDDTSTVYQKGDIFHCKFLVGRIEGRSLEDYSIEISVEPVKSGSIKTKECL